MDLQVFSVNDYKKIIFGISSVSLCLQVCIWQVSEGISFNNSKFIQYRSVSYEYKNLCSKYKAHSYGH
jgi:hypothetical protein